jgi:hypothetical protein
MIFHTARGGDVLVRHYVCVYIYEFEECVCVCVYEFEELAGDL